MALVAAAVRDPMVRSYFAALLDRCGLSTAEREAIWRSFERRAEALSEQMGRKAATAGRRRRSLAADHPGEVCRELLSGS
jgi:hypothetical protein